MQLTTLKTPMLEDFFETVKEANNEIKIKPIIIKKGLLRTQYVYVLTISSINNDCQRIQYETRLFSRVENIRTSADERVQIQFAAECQLVALGQEIKHSLELSYVHMNIELKPLQYKMSVPYKLRKAFRKTLRL